MNVEQRMSELSEQITRWRQQGVKEVILKLSPEQHSFVEKKLHILTIPYIYEIRTRKIAENVAKAPWILKEINRCHREGKKKIYKKLCQKDLRILVSSNVRHRAFKFRLIIAD